MPVELCTHGARASIFHWDWALECRRRCSLPVSWRWRASQSSKWMLASTTVLPFQRMVTCTRGDGVEASYTVRAGVAAVLLHAGKGALGTLIAPVIPSPLDSKHCSVLVFAVCAGYGGLGHGDMTTQPQPALVESLSAAGLKMIDISCGQRHTLSLSSDGGVFSWGSGEFGRCGNGKSKQPLPEPVDLLSSTRCLQVSAGQVFSVAVTEAHDLYVWGKNDQAQLGLGANMTMDINTMEEYPLRVESMSKRALLARVLASVSCARLRSVFPQTVWFLKSQLVGRTASASPQRSRCITGARAITWSRT